MEMGKDKIINDICSIIEKEYSISINQDSKLLDEFGFDSIMIIDLVVGLENLYNIEFDVDDLVLGNFETVAKVADIVKGYLMR